MIVVDANLLIYAHDASSPHFNVVRRWFEKALSSFEPVGIPWSSIHAFLRITTSSRILASPYSIEEAWSIVESWFETPVVVTIEPGSRYRDIFRRLLTGGLARGNLVMDAHLAALTIEQAATLYSADKDFTRFDELRVANPIRMK